MKYTFLQLKSQISKLDTTLPLSGFLFAFFAYTFLIKEFSSSVLGDLLGPKNSVNTTILFKSAYSLLGLLFSVLLALFFIRKQEIYLSSPAEKTESRIQNIVKFSSGCVLYLLFIPFTSLSHLKFSFISDPSQGYIAFLIICLVMQLPRKKIELLMLLSIICGPIIVYMLFALKTHGLPLFTDDHGSVIYRLALLKENFPAIPTYNTEWNAGTDWRDFFATGILNVFFIFSPVLYLFDTLTAYNFIPPALLLILLPLATYKAAYILSNNKQSSLIASALAICSSSIWYRWGLSYGSLGFVCSACLFSLTCVLLLKCLKNNDKTSWSFIIFTNIIATLSIQWSALMLALIPVILVYLWNFKLILSSKKLLILCMSLVAINIPWIVTFVHVSKVLSFVQTNKSDTKRIDVTKVPDKKTLELRNTEGSKVESSEDISEIKKIGSRIREFGSKVNPIIFILLIPSLLLFKFKQRDYFLEVYFIYAWLLLLGILGPSIKPQLELERMLVILSIFSAIPLSFLITSIFNRCLNETFLSRLTLATISVWIMLGFVVVGSIFQNKAWDKFVTWTNNAQILKDRVVANYSGGRLLFAGFVLHDFDGGHIAYLTKILNIPLVASSPVHNLWQYKDVMPGSFLERGIVGVENFMDLYNASLIAAHEKNWREYFKSQPDYFTEVARAGKFTLFKRTNFKDNYFISGSGNVLTQSSSGLTLKVNSSNAVIKFKYYDFLEVSGCESILPHNIENSEDLVFTSLTNCNPNAIVYIKSKSIFKRVFGL